MECCKFYVTGRGILGRSFFPQKTTKHCLELVKSLCDQSSRRRYSINKISIWPHIKKKKMYRLNLYLLTWVQNKNKHALYFEFKYQLDQAREQLKAEKIVYKIFKFI